MLFFMPDNQDFRDGFESFVLGLYGVDMDWPTDLKKASTHNWWSGSSFASDLFDAMCGGKFPVEQYKIVS